MEDIFVRKNNKFRNVRYPNLCHEIVTIGDEQQFNNIINVTNDDKEKTYNIEKNIFYKEPFELWEKFRSSNYASINKTFKYIFYKIKKGIFVSIKENKIQNFIYFINLKFRNEFSDYILYDKTKWKNVTQFINYINKKQGYPLVQNVNDTTQWYTNNGIFRYDENINYNNIDVIYDMFKTLCQEKTIPDINFFINKRDFPIFKLDETEPYDNVFPALTPLKSFNFSDYCPTLSFSKTNEFADVLIPTYDDWKSCDFLRNNDIPYIPWENKKSVAVFRGSSTGIGPTIETNKRLKLLSLFDNLNDDDKLLYDIGITKWQLRPRKHKNYSILKTIERKHYNKSNFLNMQQQQRYKYIIHIEGNSAAYRLSKELGLCSVILKVDSCYYTWFDYLLIPYVHYVPIKSDLSDLNSQLKWCINNDKKCKVIAEKAKSFYDRYLNKNSLLDYLQFTLTNIYKETRNEEKYINYYSQCILHRETNFLKNIQSNISSYLIKNLDSITKNINKESNKSFNYAMWYSINEDIFLNSGSAVRNTKEDKLILINNKYKKNKNNVISLYRLENSEYKIVFKKPINNGVNIIHENFIGYHVNEILQKFPNFIYTFISPKNFNSGVYTNFVNGLTLSEWIQSSQYNFKDLLTIFIQIFLALDYAQNTVGFYHKDLYPWNIILYKCENYENINYPTQLNSEYYISVKTEFIPIMIDYGNSQIIKYHSKNKIYIKYTKDNIFNNFPLIDICSLLYGTSKILYQSNKFNKMERELLTYFKNKIIHFEDFSYWSTYNNLYNVIFMNNFQHPNQLAHISITEYINYFLDYHQHFLKDVVMYNNENFHFVMEKTNPLLYYLQLKTNRYIAVKTFFDILLKNKFILHNDNFLHACYVNLYNRYTKLIHKEIILWKDNYIYNKWFNILKLLNTREINYNENVNDIKLHDVYDKFFETINESCVDVEKINFLSETNIRNIENNINDDIKYYFRFDWILINIFIVEYILFNKNNISRMFVKNINLRMNTFLEMLCKLQISCLFK
jgi:hypothetical protein